MYINHLEIISLQHGVPVFDVPESSNPLQSKELQTYLTKVRAAGVKVLQTPLFSAHQMGSCRMSSSPTKGVVNPNGESWEIKNLYLADASIFPTASGVNPMLTTFSIAHSVAQFIKMAIIETMEAKL